MSDDRLFSAGAHLSAGFLRLFKGLLPKEVAE